MKCRECKRDFPAHLIQELVSSDERGNLYRRMMCPLCALHERNAMHGLPPDTPFRGPIAKAIYEEALEHVQAQGGN